MKFPSGTVAGNFTLTAIQQLADDEPVKGAAKKGTAVAQVDQSRPVIWSGKLAPGGQEGEYELELTGFSTPRHLNEALFEIALESGETLEPESRPRVQLRSLLSDWYRSDESWSTGSEVTITFTLDFKDAKPTKLSVQLANDFGLSDFTCEITFPSGKCQNNRQCEAVKPLPPQ